MSKLHQAAMAYAHQGLAIFPLNGKAPYKDFKWRERASSDPIEVNKIWQRWPSANIGIPTGKVNGIWVLDFDGGAGEQAFREMEFEQGLLDQLAKVRTGRGFHLYFTCPPSGEVRNRAGVRAGVDVRGEGGYVVAPPSVHPDTEVEYAWF